jgi:hypothetical protein
MAPANSSCSPAFLYKNGTNVNPLTYSVFLSKLKRFLSVLGINNTLYSGKSKVSIQGATTKAKFFTQYHVYNIRAANIYYKNIKPCIKLVLSDS